MEIVPDQRGCLGRREGDMTWHCPVISIRIEPGILTAGLADVFGIDSDCSTWNKSSFKMRNSGLIPGCSSVREKSVTRFSNRGGSGLSRRFDLIPSKDPTNPSPFLQPSHRAVGSINSIRPRRKVPVVTITLDQILNIQRRLDTANLIVLQMSQLLVLVECQISLTLADPFQTKLAFLSHWRGAGRQSLASIRIETAGPSYRWFSISP